MKRIALFLVAVMAVMTAARPARAEDLREASPAESARYGVTGGILAAVTPALVGGLLLAGNDGKLQTQNSAIILMQSGFALAPFITHAAAGEWRRGLVFSAVPSASIIGMLVLLNERPRVFADINKNDSRYVFAALLGISVITGVIGIADGFGAPDRIAHRKKTSTVLAPTVVPGGGGLSLAHSF